MGVNASIEGSNPSFSVDAGRVAVVSGANRGIGREVAYGLAARGFTTVLGSRDPVRGEEAARALAARGVEVLPGTSTWPTTGASRGSRSGSSASLALRTCS